APLARTGGRVLDLFLLRRYHRQDGPGRAGHWQRRGLRDVPAGIAESRAAPGRGLWPFALRPDFLRHIDADARGGMPPAAAGLRSPALSLLPKKIATRSPGARGRRTDRPRLSSRRNGSPGE